MQWLEILIKRFTRRNTHLFVTRPLGSRRNKYSAVNARHVDDIALLFRELPTITGAVSWTDIPQEVYHYVWTGDPTPDLDAHRSNSASNLNWAPGKLDWQPQVAPREASSVATGSYFYFSVPHDGVPHHHRESFNGSHLQEERLHTEADPPYWGSCKMSKGGRKTRGRRLVRARRQTDGK